MYSYNFFSMEDAVTTQITSNEWSHRHATDQTTACQNKDKLSMSWFRPCLHESLCKTVKWHRVLVLSRRWWISVHMWNKQWLSNPRWSGRTQGLHAQEMFWDMHLKSYGISGDETILRELKLLLARAGILFTLLFCAAVLNYATD